MRWPSRDWDEAGGFYRAVKFLCTDPARLALRIDARGAEGIPMAGPLIFTPNHWSYVDPIVLGAVSGRPVINLAKAELFVHPLSRWFFGDVARQIPIQRSAGRDNAVALSQAAEALRGGRALGVYPEGTISTSPNLLPGKTGAARLALATGSPVLPVALLTDAFLPRSATLPTVGARIYVNVGRPIQLGNDLDAANSAEALREATNVIMTEIRRLVDEGLEARRAGDRWNWTPINATLR
ncbi:MAG: lysophospholipid acyltransferase family protein [Thermoplasmatota archaeon]